MNEKGNMLLSKIKIPQILLLLVVVNLFWGLWSDISFAGDLYSLASLGLVVWLAVYALQNIKNNVNGKVMFVYACIILWAALMFLVYQKNGGHSTVSFFGILMDSYAQLMIYYLILLLPGFALKDTCRINTNALFKLIVTVIVLSNLVFTLQAVIVNPDALRARASADASVEQEFISFGLPDYSMIYSTSLFLPWLLMKAKGERTGGKLLYLVLSVCLLITIALSQFATALLAAVVGLVVYYVYTAKDKPIRALVLVVAVLIFLAIGMDTWGNMLIDWSYGVEGSWGEKLYEIGAYLTENEATGDLGSRLDLYSDSLDSFFNSPVVGKLLTGDGKIGGHSTLFDMLGLVGLVGTLPFVALIIVSFRSMLKKTVNSTQRASVWATMAIFIVFLVYKNITSAIAILFTFLVIVPILHNSEAQNELDKKANLQ